jgi:hypothetical protein
LFPLGKGCLVQSEVEKQKDTKQQDR